MSVCTLKIRLDRQLYRSSWCLLDRACICIVHSLYVHRNLILHYVTVTALYILVTLITRSIFDKCLLFDVQEQHRFSSQSTNMLVFSCRSLLLSSFSSLALLRDSAQRASPAPIAWASTASLPCSLHSSALHPSCLEPSPLWSLVSLG